MDIPDDADIQETKADVQAEVANLEAKINEIASNLARDEKGKYIIPDELTPAERVAVLAERRRRDTQSGYTQAMKQTKALEAEKAALLKKVSAKVELELTAEQAEELEELKFSDPEAWRVKMNQYESAASKKQRDAIDEELKQVSATTLDTEELERRKQVLVEFNQAHPDLVLNDDVIANDIPPRIVKRLETGAVTFEAFLQECVDYLTAGKVVGQEKLPGKQPNLGKVGGGTKPDDNAVKEDIIMSYANEIY